MAAKDWVLLAVGTALGFVTGLLSWFVVYRGIRPGVRFSKQISVIPSVDVARRWHYRFKLANQGRRDLVEARLSVSLRLPGLNPAAPTSVSVLSVAVDEPSIELMRPRRRGGKDRVIWMGREVGSVIQQERLRKRLGISADVPIDLHSALEAFPTGSLQVVAIASDGFSGARHAYEAMYNATDLVFGQFDGLDVVSDTAHRSNASSD